MPCPPAPQLLPTGHTLHILMHLRPERPQNKSGPAAFRLMAAEPPAFQVSNCQLSTRALSWRLERELSRQLYPARRASAQERIANSNVSSRTQTVKSLTYSVRSDTPSSGIRDKIRQQWV